MATQGERQGRLLVFFAVVTNEEKLPVHIVADVTGVTSKK